MLAAEKSVGEPLTREQVGAVRDGAACMAMDHRDAQRFERSRYADIDPELVWEQWRVLR